jgi:hypothetical protein
MACENERAKIIHFFLKRIGAGSAGSEISRIVFLPGCFTSGTERSLKQAEPQ